VVRNLYQPLLPGKSDRHYMVVARLTVPAVLGLGIAVGLYLNSVIAILKFAIVLLVIWGVPITLIFLWRRLTETAVRIQVVATIIFIAVIPAVVPLIPALAQSETLTLMTREREVVTPRAASATDVTMGAAAVEGGMSRSTRLVEPVPADFGAGGRDGGCRVCDRWHAGRGSGGGSNGPQHPDRGAGFGVFRGGGWAGGSEGS